MDFQSIKTFKLARSLDVSARGMFLRKSDALPVGEEVLVRFNLSGVAHAFKSVGCVMWSSPTDTPQGLPAEMGVQFLNLEAQEQTLIERSVVELPLDRALLEESRM